MSLRDATRDSGYDVIVVGSGPNGLACAAYLARAGLSTLVIESHALPGGGARTLPLTLPGFDHDACSTVHPLGAASPVFRALELEKHGLSWIEPPAALVHVIDESNLVTLEHSIDATAAQLGSDARAYRRLFARFSERFDDLCEAALGPLHVPMHPLLLAELGMVAFRSLRGLVTARFREARAPALLAGVAAHAMLRLDDPATASFAIVLGAAAHAVGWPLARGGSRAIVDALLAVLRAHGGEVWTDFDVKSLDDLPPARAYVLDVTPRQVLAIAGDRLPGRYVERLARFRYGPGVFKMDWALDGPIPWRDPRCARSATVHLSGTFDDVAAAEEAVHLGRLADAPFILLVQPTLFDPSRAPVGKHIAWAYCHVPHASPIDASDAIEQQIERFAPGFRDRVLARATRTAPALERYNANYVGGDINGGSADLGQLFFRPVRRADPYATPANDIFICSSSTPPGGGVHGMCGYYAARSVLRRVFGRAVSSTRTRLPVARGPSSPLIER